MTTERQLPSGTVTLLFTDIEGSTRMLQELGREAYVRALTEHRRLLREAFTSHGGSRWRCRALQAARLQGDQRTESFVLENLALAKLQLGMIKPAGDYFAASLGMAQRLGFVELAAEDLVGIAAVATARGCFEDAARLLGGARRLREEIGATLDPLEALMAAQTAQELQRNRDPEEYSEAQQSGADLHLDELAAIALACIA